MDNSQSSDFFKDAAELRNESVSAMPLISYESMLVTTKEAMSGYNNEVTKSTMPTYFATVLDNSWTCITHSLEDLIKGLLLETPVLINKIIEYLNDSVFLLQMLSNIYKSLIESVPMSCGSLKTLPRQTGLIVYSVFVHCRDSESLYGHHLRSVEKQLKDLFRNCHELQLTYLLILEKHFNLDLTEEEDKSIMVEALRINLNIGKVVQSLDVKTMAEQWKAYTVICEKYSSDLRDTSIFLDCSQVLCTLIKDNIETAVENNQDDNLVGVRSLKVSNFTIKIIRKICDIFRLSSNKDYSHIVELLQYIWINNARCLEMSAEKSFSGLMNNNVEIVSDWLKELLLEEQFVDEVFLSHTQGYGENREYIKSQECLLNAAPLKTDEISNDENLVGYLLIITSAMKSSTQANRRLPNNLKTKLFNCVYSLLPCFPAHIWFDRRVRLTASHAGPPRSALAHALAHAAALARTLTCHEFSALEKTMIESILATECAPALFSSYLWLLLARYISPQLLFNQLIWLCTMYKKLDTYDGVSLSPQRIHLSRTITGLFTAMLDEDKLKICKQFRIHDEDNVPLWTALRIRNLPVEARGNAEQAIADKLKTSFNQLQQSESPDMLINITNLAATCSFKDTGGIDDLLVRLWSKACQRTPPVRGLDKDTVWFYDYVKAVVALTDSVMSRLRERRDNFIKVVHIVCGLIRTGDTEMKLILINILCRLATCEHNNHADSHVTDAFTSLLQDSNDIVRNKLFTTLRNYRQNKYLDNMVTNIVRENDTLEDTWMKIRSGKYINPEEFISSDTKYIHKCLENKHIEMCTTAQELKEGNLNDFYFDSSGSEMLFETESMLVETESVLVETEGNEPPSKRGRPNTDEADCIIRSLEENVSFLVRRDAYTPDQLIRIRKACEKLKNKCA